MTTARAQAMRVNVLLLFCGLLMAVVFFVSYFYSFKPYISLPHKLRAYNIELVTS